MRFIDTHAHLYDEAFDNDIDEVVSRIKEAGVCKCILPAIDKASFQRQSSFAERHQGFAFEAMGLHPTSVNETWESEMELVTEALEKDRGRYKAVGEIGLDGYWSREFMEQQKIVFSEQLRLARKYDLPVIIHLREATDDLFSLLDMHHITSLSGVFHAFSGSVEIYRRLKKYGDIKIGIGGVVTYKNAAVARTVEEIPLEDILLETDSPYLTPVPYRGKRNESSYLTYIAERIAQIKGVDIQEVAEVTSKNAGILFQI